MSRFKTPVGQILAPNIPITYKHHIRCMWKIEVPFHLKLALKLNVPWSNEDGECENYLLIHNDKYERKHGLNTRRICSKNDDHQVIMESNSAVIDFVVKVRKDLPMNIQLGGKLSLSGNFTKGNFH